MLQVEDNLENYFSSSESEYEPDTSEAESTDSEQYDLVRRKKLRPSVTHDAENGSRMETNENRSKYFGVPENRENNVVGDEVVAEGERHELELEESYPEAHMNASAAGNVSDTANNGKQNNLGPGLRGKNGHRWCTIPNMPKRISSRNIVHIVQGPSGAAREAQTPLDVFLCLFNESILEKILIHTNTEIRIKSEKYKTAKATTSQTSRDELLALFGLLVFSGAQKDNHLSARDMFDYKMSGSIYRATMSCERFNFLIESLRFDDKTTLSLAGQLLELPYKLTLVGTMRHNKREVPAEMINLKNRELGVSIFCYDRTKTLVSIKTKRNKSVLILSTMHMPRHWKARN
nr:unnamed protein product [Callosobruchus analis]